MQRIMTDTGLFQSGDPTQGIPGTIVTAKWLNDVQEELCAIVAAAGIDPDGTSQDQILQALRTTFFDNRTGSPILYMQTMPSAKVVDVIYVIDKACFMRWQTIGSWTGYASDGLMDLVIGTTIDPKPNEIDLIGGTYSKAKYPALWAKAQANNLVIAASAWAKKMFRFVDLGGDNFRVPDLRDTFIRATGFDSDSENARELGSYQADAMQRIVGAIQAQSDSGLSGVPIVSATSTGALNYVAAGTMPYSTTSSNSIRMYSVRFDSGLVARTSTETRSSNTAFHLRLCAY